MANGEQAPRRATVVRKHGEQMEVREIKALLVLMRDYGLVELEIEDKKGKVRLVRGAARGTADEGATDGTGPLAAGTLTPIKIAPGRHVEARAEDAGEVAGGIELAPNQKLIESPMVGTFYRAASPDAAPFVEEGSSVRKGQPLCIIEAMKMMNEIESPAAGRVVRILAENGKPIEYGQPLMIVEVA
ncbi:MAG TPA: acetyl-CoA carboxylase biotin carboxyl carrier protein [Candidatus Acidoferrales bacterium]|nr:acetyl-CoA carboxylase biotin carboxyl carrier protein [Candidatus Acidoferrales bacterium]